ncbi:MAG TPA: HD domain-containing phosphohydrolase [Pirellulales bacterium]
MKSLGQQKCKILVVDDDPCIRRLFRATLDGDHLVLEAASGQEALMLAADATFDLLLLDITMPGLGGYKTCRRLKSAPDRAPQIIMVSACSSSEEQIEAFRAGADDYLVKPVNPCDLRSRVQLQLKLRESLQNTARLKNEVENFHGVLRRTATERAQQIIALQDVAVFTLARMAESRDSETGAHLLRLREYAQILAEDLAQRGPYVEKIDEEFLCDLYRSSPLHDIGKVGISDELLLRAGPLTRDEFEVMKRHTVIGANILNDAVMQLAAGGFLAMGATIARSHHERWDGTGYLAGLVGEEIPLAARIVSVADVYDALTSERPYKSAWDPEAAKEAIEAGSGSQFDPAVVDSFRRRFDSFLAVQRQHGDPPSIVTGAMAFAEFETVLN